MNRYLLEYHIKAAGYSIKEFCEAVGMPKVTYYKKVRDKFPNEFTRPEIDKCIDLLDLSSSDVMEIFFNDKVS